VATDTRDRILVAAADLFAARGFHGTSTRDIARAVGIRQPSLYSHFATKQLILAALLDADLVPALRRIERMLAADGPCAPRLHAWLHVDVEAILSLPFDVRGLYDDAALATPELAEQAARRSRLHAGTRRLVAAGVASGEFDADAGFVGHAITGLTLEAVRERSGGGAPPGRGADVADFVLRAVLTDPTSLAAVREAARRLHPLLTGA
jgi:AcrR family transcriptional regulator